MDFAPSARGKDLLARVQDFMDTEVLPAEAEYKQYRLDRGPADHSLPPVVEGDGSTTYIRLSVV